MKYILGIDVGGTKVASALVDENYTLSQVQVVPTSQTDLLQQIIDIIGQYQEFRAIGIAIPGPVVGGLVKRLPNVPNFKPTDFKQILAEKFNLPVEVENDAKSFAYFEAIQGAGIEKRTVVGLVLGTGTGVGVVIDKKILSGKDGLVGEYDHILTPDGKMLREYVKLARPFKDAVAAKPYLQSLISFIVLGYNPDLIVLSGGWSDLPGMKELLNEITVNVGAYENQTPVLISKNKYPSLLGVALLALNLKQ